MLRTRSNWECLTFFFFFQAEDGIRDYKVTGVQTCALPICCVSRNQAERSEGPSKLPVCQRLRRGGWGGASPPGGRVGLWSDSPRGFKGGRSAEGGFRGRKGEGGGGERGGTPGGPRHLKKKRK